MLDKKYVKSLIKALSIIELLDEHGEMGVTEIGTSLSLDKSTTFRILNTLKEKHYVNANPRTQKYSNSGKFFLLGQGVLRRHNMNPVLTMELKKLAERIHETVNLAVPDGTEVVYLASYETADIVKLRTIIGSRRPMYCTSAGKAILAHYKPEYAKVLCDHFEFRQFTEHTCTSPEDLEKELADIRQRGYSVDNQEHNLGIHCLGIPLLDSHGTPLAAVSISIPQFRHEADPQKHALCAQALLDSSEALTRAILC